MGTRRPLSQVLPDFPWDTIADVKRKAASHPDGLIDLSVGGPVDEVPPAIQLALAENSAAPGYPQTMGTPELRATIVAALDRRFGIAGLNERAVLPTIGLKEAIAWLPTLLGLRGQTEKNARTQQGKAADHQVSPPKPTSGSARSAVSISK